MIDRSRTAAWWDAMRNVRSGTEALRAHRLRSVLTTLGVVFGVGAVISMMAIGKGAERQVLSELQRLGVHNLHVESRPPAEGKESGRGLVEEDARAAAALLHGHATGAVPESVRDVKIWAGARGADVRLSGVTPDYAAYLDLRVVDGRFVAPLDVADGSGVCVLSEPLAAALFPARRAVGSVVRLGGQALRVVGVVQGLALGSERRPPVFVPLSLSWRILPLRRDPQAIHRIIVRLEPDTDASGLARVLGASILRRHGGTRDFTVIVPSELIRKEQRTQRIFQIVMGSIAGISLLVGGIGITNIMFANVLERTSEIGLRRAVGARRQDIRTQFLFEAAVIGGTGGIIGIVVGVLGAVVVGRSANWPIAVTPASIVLSTGMALATGLVSGFVPARQAAHVEAIVALRHE